MHNHLLWQLSVNEPLCSIDKLPLIHKG